MSSISSRIKKSHFILALAIMFAAAGEARATSYYVDGAAPVSGNGTSWDQAWRSFSTIEWGKIAPGDTLYISGGSAGLAYPETLSPAISGAAGQPITIKRSSEPGHDGPVTIDGVSSAPLCVEVKSQNYLEFDGFDVKNCTEAGFQIHNTRGITVRNCEVHAFSRGFHIWQSRDVAILSNLVTTPAWTHLQTDGIYSRENTNNRYWGNEIIIANDEPTGHDDGIQSSWDSNISVIGNYVEQRNDKTSNAQGIFMTDASGAMVVINNVVNGPHTYNSLIKLLNFNGTGGSLFAYNNTLKGGRWGVIQIQDSPGSHIYNNIIYTTATFASGIAFMPGNLPPASYVNYNLYYVPNGKPGQIIGTSFYDWSQWKAFGYESKGIATALAAGPGIISADFSPVTGSPAIDAGVTLTKVPTDFAGRPRPAGAKYDIGAYEGPLP